MKRTIFYSLYMVVLLSTLHAAHVGDILSNQAKITYSIDSIDKNQTTNEVNLSVAQTKATIEFLAFDPANNTNIETIPPTAYLDSSGHWHSMPPSPLSDGTTLTPPQDIGVVHTTTYRESDIVIIRVTDLDQDTNASAIDTIEINVTNPNTNDTERLLLQETNANSGVFVGYINTTPDTGLAGDGAISVETNDIISAIYIDNGTLTKVEAKASIIATKFRLLAKKIQSKEIASIGEYIKYTVTIENISSILLHNVLIEDMIPDGIKYTKGTLKINRVRQKAQLSADGRTLSYTKPSLSAGASVELSYVALVTAGIIDHKATNRAWASSRYGGTSNIAKVTLQIKEELYRSHGYIMGQVYDANVTKDTNNTKNTTDSNVSQKYGIEGVKLYMEDGRFVVTDAQGKYHFIDVTNGSHIVQIDDMSIKGEYELAQCEHSIRSAGSKRSQFVDVYHGGISRVDFCLQKRVIPDGNVSIDINIKKHSSKQLALDISVASNVPLGNPEMFLSLPAGVTYTKNSISEGDEPTTDKEMLIIKIKASEKKSILLDVSPTKDIDKEIRAILYYDSLSDKNQHSEVASVMFRSKSAKNADIAKIVKAKDHAIVESAEGNISIDEGDYNWTKSTSQVNMPEYRPSQVDKLGKKSRIVWPPEDWVPDIPSAKIAILCPKGSSVDLKLNGVAVSLLNYDSTFKDSNGTMQVIYYKGVDLKPDSNIITATIKDKKGKVVAKSSRSVFVETHAPMKVELLPKYSYLVADEKHSPILAVKFTGATGHPLRGGLVGAYTTDSRHAPATMNNGSGQYTIDSDGVAYIDLKPTGMSGKVKLQFKLRDGTTASVVARLKPHPRDWILVGYAEGTVGYRTLSGNSVSLANNGVDQSLYTRGRMAFFAKGRIKGDWLLTMAYDTGKRAGDKKLFDSIDPDAYYTIYNDATKQGNEAQSTKKLYVKLEKDETSILLGDFKTGMSKTDLSSYNRSFTGIKAKYEGANVTAKAFVAKTSNLFFYDEIRGNDTSGYYHLSHKPIVIASESVTIEVRDRNRPEIILDTKELQRYRDYDIDYDAGTLYFKDVVYSSDKEFNPRYIIVKYDVNGDGQNYYSYGGRATYTSDDGKHQVGASFVSEDNGRGVNKLYGVDSTVDIGLYTKLKAEYAYSNNTIDGNSTSGTASKLTINYEKDDLKLQAYWRKQDASFGLGQLSHSLSATRKIGIDASTTLFKDDNNESNESIDENVSTADNVSIDDNETNDTKDKGEWKLNGTTYQNRRYEDDGSTNDEYVLQSTISFQDKLWNGSLGYRFANNTNTAATHQIIGKIARSYWDGNLTVSLSHAQSLMSNEDDQFPTDTTLVLGYKYDANTTLSTSIKRADRDGDVSWESHTGVTYKPWQDAKLTLDRIYKSGNDGFHTYDTMGLGQSFQVDENLSMTASYSKGIDHDNSSNDFDAVNISVQKDGERYNSTMSAGYRNSKKEDTVNLTAGVHIVNSDAVGMAFAAGYHNLSSADKEDTSLDAKMAYVYRPEMTDWIVLDRFDYTDKDTTEDDVSTQTTKMINNLHLHWKPDIKWRLGAQYGLKFVTDNIDGDEYSSWTDLAGLHAIYDINSKWAIGVQGSVLHSYTGNNKDYSLGLFTTTNIWKNSDLTVGYNLQGFNDDDFSQQNYHFGGAYIKFKIKFDQNSMKSLLKGAME